ncbi:glycerol-3-phosphate dehydrogenase/oxidase [Dictyobacter aurantiacus]|uniref:Glycerol-3-phosphate dehydrogenase n=1 Tax=Dictyobacter aurantiacus TaxID=1936993 RepID=A0A401ZT90_9CHLR|nr:glycerol-3-phosphate dehydrogenase/oxidase [Dictyobacter aurantiacus]GCE09994.1 glycerol-3-phosphate dehydrogenase [Dictyobacter aurantiacus]
MQLLSSTTRSRNLSHLASEHFDVLVIGGGVTGAGVALDAAARGYSVALVEKNDFASGTSSKSTKLVHGGIRYLPNFDFALVHEALVERGLLLQNAPYLVTPVEFVLPIYKGDRHPVGMPFTTPGGVGLSLLLDIGLWMYDLMSGGRGVKFHRHLSREKVLNLAPALVQTNLKEGFTYYDAQTNDARLTMALIRTASRYGATITNYSEVTSFVKENGKVTGAIVRDRFSEEEYTVRARHIVNAAGVFSGLVEDLTGMDSQVSIEPSKGVHLVLRREDLQLGETAIVLPETEDKRILFVVPWGSRAVFGTTDTGRGDLDHPTVTQDDISYLLKYLNMYMNVNLSEQDIISTYAGYRPLVKPRNKNASTAKLSRSHVVLESTSGLVTITGGKLTTYRRMAQDTVDVLSRRDGMKPLHPTEALPLQGSAGWSSVRHSIEKRGQALGLSKHIIDHLGASYGTVAQEVLEIIEQDATLAAPLIDDLPYIKAEVVYACRYEMAMTPGDVLAHRTSIELEDKQRGLGVINEVAALMSKELGWSENQQEPLSAAYRDAIEFQLAAEKKR